MTGDKPGEIDHIREFYDKEYYSGMVIRHTELPWHCRMVAARIRLPETAQVLDVACGTGEWLDYFDARGAQISGIDLSARAIEICRRRFKRGKFHCGPAESLPFNDHQFDLVTCMGALEHFLDKSKSLREIKRVAKEGAGIVILVPIAGFLTRRLGLYHGTQQARIREDVLELGEWEKLLLAEGLIVEDKWRDLHPLSWRWIRQGRVLTWPIRALQACALAVWPLGWQYQVYFFCRSS